MKIVYCIPSLINSGGTERIVTEKANFLADSNNYEIYIVTTEEINLKSFYNLNPNVKIIEFNINFNEDYNSGIINKVYKTKKKLKIYYQLLKSFIINNKIDICVSTGAKEMEFFYKLNPYCKTISELHFAKNIRKDFISTRKKGLIWQILGEIRTRQLISQTKRLNRLVVLTKADEEDWLKTNNNVSQIYNFSSFATDISAKLTAKRAIAVGRLEPEKGFDKMIEAWKIVHEHKKDWVLDIFGEGQCDTMLIEKVKQYNLNNNVVFHGRTNDVQGQLLNSSFFILSSKYEGFALVIVESFSLGVPAVSFNCKPGPGEIMEDSKGGILVENGNVNELAEGILQMIQDEDLRISKGIEAKERAQRFSKKLIMQQWIDLFEEVYAQNKKK